MVVRCGTIDGRIGAANPARLRPAVPIVPHGASADEIEAIVAAAGAAVMTDEQAGRLEAHFSEGVTSEGVAR